MVLLRRAALAAAAVLAGCTIQFLEEGPYEESFSVVGQSAIEVVGLDGDVVVSGAPAATLVVIRGTRRAIGSTEERARENLERVFLEPRTDGGSLVLAFDPPLEKVGLLDLELDRESEVPEHMGLAVEVSEGNLSVTGLAGTLDLETGEGDVQVAGAGPGRVDVRIGDGDAAVEALGPVAVDVGGKASVAVPGVDLGPVTVETGGHRIDLGLVPQALELYCYLEGGQLTVDPALGLQPMNDGDGAEYYVTESAEFDGPRKLVKLWSHGGDIAIHALTENQIP